MRTTTGIGVLVLALLAAACGGGGDDGPIPPPPSAESLFDGDYFQHTIGGNSQPANTGIVMWGTLTGDGAGTYSWLASQNHDGVISAIGSGVGLPYSISSDRSVTWWQGATPRWQGGISASGDVMGLGNNGDLLEPAMSIQVQAGSGLGAADLDGSYHFAGYGFVNVTHVNQGTWGTATFDGASAGDLTWYANEEGVVSGGVSEPLSYAVAGDGAVDLTVGTTDYEGGVLAGGDLAVVSGGTAAGDEPFLVAFFPQSTAATTALFDGTYFVVGIERERGVPPAIPANRTYSGTLVADGAGGLTPSLRQNEEGSAMGVSPLWGGYTVDLDGTLTVTAGAGETWEGAVSPDGRFAMVSGGSNAGNDPVFFFFFK